ncbi:hypothetical protein HMJ29_03650 [Hymenobacter taeanensis]|uniref:Lipoprotein n=1 Tax=Hymenobacter taeanensis TaxID=2735321 RepID=A0A6M6BCC7_9BACT|nr:MULTISPECIES: hypothetical protein [Hymenobacter]QJX46081.1 hypothetical protein HMJ29_03650 [Hymenobacter taeanensis]UOQ79935.1 hypothetical protein MUN83_13905 [Hymenobacter sp. 5414T-23]
MRNQIALLLILVAGASACDKEETEPGPANPVTVRYAQTNCADPWATTAPNTTTDEGFQQAVQQYVEQKGVKLYGIKISNSASQVTCRACACPTGKVLEAKVEATEVATVKQIGFKQP